MEENQAEAAELVQIAEELVGEEKSETDLSVEDEAIALLKIEGEADETEAEAEEEITEEAPDDGETETTEEDETEADETEDTEEAEAEEESEATEHLLIGKSGGEDYEIPKDLTFMQKVNGEEKEVTLQQLRDDYAGGQNWDRKNTELSERESTFQGEVDSFNNNATKFNELVDQGKAQEALDVIFEAAGVNKHRFVNAYVSQLAPTISEYLELTPAEQEQQEAKQQSDYYKDQLEKLKHNHTVEKESQLVRGQILKVLDTHKMDSARFEELQKELIQFSEQGQLAREKITPEYVGQYHEMILQDELARDVLESLKPELSKDKASLDYLISLQKNNPGISKDDLKKKAKEAFIKEKSEKVVKRVKKNSKATKAKSLSKKGVKTKKRQNTIDTALTFDDLDINDLINELK